MFHKIVDVLKEVFWLKPSSKKRGSAGRRKTAKKTKTVRKSVRKSPAKPKLKPKPTAKPPLKPAKAPVAKPKAAKPPASKKLAVKAPIDPNLAPVGEITHYFDRIKVCVVQINQGTVLIGDKLTIIGPKTKFVQKVWSMQIESEDVKVAKKGQLIGIKVDKLVAVADKVYKAQT